MFCFVDLDSSINHVDNFLDILPPLQLQSPPLWTTLQNRAKIVILTFGSPQFPCPHGLLITPYTSATHLKRVKHVVKKHSIFQPTESCTNEFFNHI